MKIKVWIAVEDDLHHPTKEVAGPKKGIVGVETSTTATILVLKPKEWTAVRVQVVLIIRKA